MVTYDNAYYVPAEGLNPALLWHDITRGGATSVG